MDKLNPIFDLVFLCALLLKKTNHVSSDINRYSSPVTNGGIQQVAERRGGRIVAYSFEVNAKSSIL